MARPTEETEEQQPPPVVTFSNGALFQQAKTQTAKSSKPPAVAPPSADYLSEGEGASADQFREEVPRPPSERRDTAPRASEKRGATK